MESVRRFKALTVIASCVVIATLATTQIVSAAPPKAGAKCTKVGLAKTVKQKTKLVNFVCVTVGKKLVWQIRPTGTTTTVPTGGTSTTTAPTGGTTTTTTPTGGTTTTTTPTSGSTGTSAVTEVISSYAILADTPFTRIATGTAPSGYLAAGGLATTTGASLYDHPSGLASSGTNLVLVDRGNNRILVWNKAPTSATSVPDFVLCQTSMTSNASGTSLSQCNWPSDAVVTANGKLLVADSDNDRILVWNTMPTSSGQAASFAIDLGTGSWPWGVWSNGTKVAATLTVKGQLKLWNSFPVTGTEPADITLTSDATNCLGTPRGIISNGTAVITGDHNGKCANNSVAHVFATWPTSNSAAVSYDIVPEDPNYAWPHGTFDSTTGKLYMLSKYLVEYSGAPATQPTGTKIATGTPFEGGDGGDVEIVSGYMYVSEYNGNRLAVFAGIPAAGAKASFYIGSPGVSTTSPNEVLNTLKTNYFVTNPQVATLGGAMAINSDFDRKVYVWKKIPATDGAKPDLVWTTQNQNDSNPLLAFDFQPDSSAATTAADGKPLYAVAGEKTFVVWRGIPTNKTDVPVLNIKDSIGNVSFGGTLRVAADNRYFYILDGDKKLIHVWSGIPADKNDNPDFSISAEVNRIRSDGSWLIGTSLYNAPHVLAWSVTSLGQNVAPTGRVGYQMNLPQDALVANGVLYVADTSFHRVLAWNSVSSALAGASPDAYLGATSLTDVSPAHSATDIRWPASLWVANGYLWVGERKFGHRVLRYALG